MPAGEEDSEEAERMLRGLAQVEVSEEEVQAEGE